MRTRTAAGLGGCALLIVVGCGTSDQDSKPDVSHSGQQEYACALVDHIVEVHGYPTEGKEDPDWGQIGEDASPGLVESAGVAGLLGGITGGRGPVEEITNGVHRLDFAQLRAGLEGIRTQCSDSE